MKINKVYIPLFISIILALGFVLGSTFNVSSDKGLFVKNTNTTKLHKLIDFIEREYVDSLNTDSIVDLTVSEILA